MDTPSLSVDITVTVSIHGPSMDGHLPIPLCPSIHGCHSYCVHPWTIHRWIRTPCYPPLSKYPWMSQLLCPSMDHPWMDTLLPPLSKYPWMDTLTTPLCPSIHGCNSYCVHPWTIHGQSMDGHLDYPPLSKYPWMSQLLWSMDGHLTTPLCLSICGCQNYCVHPRTIHGWTDTLTTLFCLSICCVYP